MVQSKEFPKEEDLQNKYAENLLEYLLKEAPQNITDELVLNSDTKITGIKVPYLLTEAMNGQSANIHFSQQDICLYKSFEKKDAVDLIHKKIKDIFDFDINATEIKPYRYPNADYNVPFVIIEVKHKMAITHDIMAYLLKAKLIKTIFPHCIYAYIVFDQKEKRDRVNRLERLSKCFKDSFDEIFYVQYENKGAEINFISDLHLKEVFVFLEQSLKTFKNGKN